MCKVIFMSNPTSVLRLCCVVCCVVIDNLINWEEKRTIPGVQRAP